MKKEKVLRLEDWTTNYFEESKNLDSNEIYPICIPTYKRGDKPFSIDLVGQYPELKIFVFGYKDDIEENYQNVMAKYPNITFVKCEGFRGVIPKRNFINEYIDKIGFDQFFVMDDDITGLFFTKHGTLKDGTGYKADKQQLTGLEFFRMWTWIIQNKAEKNMAICGLINEASSWCQDLRTMPDIINIAGSVQVTYLNGKLLKEKGIKYDENSGWEDYDICMQALANDLMSSQIRYLTYTTAPMTPGVSVATVGQHKWTINSIRLYQKWGELIRFKYMKGEVNAKCRWVTMRSMFKKNGCITISFKEEYMPFLKDEDAEGLIKHEAEKKAAKQINK